MPVLNIAQTASQGQTIRLTGSSDAVGTVIGQEEWVMPTTSLVSYVDNSTTASFTFNTTGTFDPNTSLRNYRLAFYNGNTLVFSADETGPSFTVNTPLDYNTVRVYAYDEIGPLNGDGVSISILRPASVSADVDLMMERLGAKGARQTGAGLGYQTPLSGLPGTTICNSQNTDGSYSVQGAFPSTPNDASIDYMGAYWRSFNKKVALDAQTNPSLLPCLWRSLKGFRDNLDLWYISAGHWTPGKWWELREFVYTMAIVKDEFLANINTTVDGEPLIDIMKDISTWFFRTDSNFNLTSQPRFTDITFSGSSGNVTGANKLGTETTAFYFGALIAYISGNTQMMEKAKEEIEKAFTESWGKVYYDIPRAQPTGTFGPNWENGTPNRLQRREDFVGITPDFGFSAHVTAGGAQPHMNRYGYSFVNNLGDLLEIIQGTSFDLSAGFSDTVVKLIQALAFESIRNQRALFTSGRQLLPSTSSPGVPGAVAAQAEDLQQYTDFFTPAQLSILADIEDKTRRARPIPTDSLFNRIVNQWATGAMMVLHPEFSWYCQGGRGARDQFDASMVPREQTGGEDTLKYSEGYVIFNMGTDLNVNDPLNYSQWINRLRGNPARTGPHGTFFQNSNSGMPTGQSSAHGRLRNTDCVQTYQNNKFAVKGGFQDKDPSWFIENRYWMKGWLKEMVVPNLTNGISFMVDLTAGGSLRGGSAVATVVHNMVMTNQSTGVTYDFGSGQQTLGTSGTLSQTITTTGPTWFWTRATTDNNYQFGQGILIPDAQTLIISASGGSFRVSIDHTTTPTNATSSFVEVAKCTIADMTELAANFSNYFDITNTSQMQGVRWVPDNSSLFCIWNTSATPTISPGVTLQSSDEIAFVSTRNGGDYNLSYAQNEWRDVHSPSTAGDTTNPLYSSGTLTITGKGSTDIEWARNFNALDRDIPDGRLAGWYYTGDTNTITI